MSDKNIKDNYGVEEREFDFKRFLFRYIKYWYVFATSVILALFIAHFYNWYTKPLYRSSCRIIIKDDNANSSAENLLKELRSDKRNSNIENEIQILKSKTLLTKAIRQLELDVTYILQGTIKSTELYNKAPFIIKYDTLQELAYFIPINITLNDQNSFRIAFKPTKAGEEKVSTHHFGEKIVNELGSFTLSKRANFNPDLQSNSSTNYIIHFNPTHNVANFYANTLEVNVVTPGSSILELSVTDAVPEACADFLNKLTEVYIINSIEQKNLLASNSIKFIDAQMQQISGELKDIEKKILAFQTANGVINIDDESKSFLERVRTYDEKLSENRIQISFIDYLEKYIQDNNVINDLSPASLGIDDPLLKKLINDLSTLESEYNKHKIDSKPNTLVFENMDKEIKRTKNAILETLKGIKQKYVLMQNEMNANLSVVEGKLSSMPKTEIELIAIKRQFSIKEGLYLFLLQKKSETSILLASSVSDSWVIDKAIPSFNPIKPVKNKSYAIGIVLGLIVPIIIISVIELLNDKIKDKEMLRAYTKIPLMGVVGFNDDNSNLFTEKKPKSIILEAFRSIRTNINYFTTKNTEHTKQNVILITSSISGEGKTFISYNLAGIIASSEKKTVLVCFDLRKPKIIEGINLNTDIGISNYLAGTSEINDIIQNSVEQPYLDVILSGQIPPNPSELILKDKTAQLFDSLRESYDYVIIDTPPIGLVTDGLLLSKYSDVNIYVVRQNITCKHHLQFINKLYAEDKISNVGIIFNSVKASKSAYGYGDGYGYGYGYE